MISLGTESTKLLLNQLVNELNNKAAFSRNNVRKLFYIIKFLFIKNN